MNAHTRRHLNGFMDPEVSFPAYRVLPPLRARETDATTTRADVSATIVGLPFDKGSQWWEGTDLAPEIIRSEVVSAMATGDAGLLEFGALDLSDAGDVAMHQTDVRRSHYLIENSLSDLYRDYPDVVPILIGGDHSVAAPSFRAYASAHDQRLGLIDFDAHNDLRNPAIEGLASSTPFRQLIDGGFVRGGNATQLGLHGFLSSSELKGYADRKGLQMVSAREIRREGIRSHLDAALARAAQQTDGVYISLDIDVMDPAFAIGTNSPCPGGMIPEEILYSMYELGRSPAVRALDIVEVDPLKDLDGLTTRLVVNIIVHFLLGLRDRGRDCARSAAEPVRTQA